MARDALCRHARLTAAERQRKQSEKPRPRTCLSCSPRAVRAMGKQKGKSGGKQQAPDFKVRAQCWHPKLAHFPSESEDKARKEEGARCQRNQHAV